MSVTVSQLNRAVSQAAVEAITTSRRFTYRNLFAMPNSQSTLSGEYSPFATNEDSGWWGNELSNSVGLLPNPAVLTVLERTSAYKYTVAGIQDNYPVDLILTLYLSDEVQKVVTITGNNRQSFDITLDKAYDIDKLELSITRISVGNDVLKVSMASFRTNISNLMKEPSRQIHGRVEVTYANAVRDAAIVVSAGAHGSSGSNLNNYVVSPMTNAFKLYDNKLDGTYKVIGETSEVGWWAKTLPTETGEYTEPQTLLITFSQRNLYSLELICNTLDFPVDFDITITNSSNVAQTINVVGNTSPVYNLDTTYMNAISVNITIYKVSRAHRPAVFLDVPLSSTLIYNDEDLIDVSLLEELSYEDALDKLGGVSANELTVNFSNEDKSFYFNNTESRVAGYLKKNRRIRAWLGVAIPDSSEVIWSILGTFWTYSWDIPVGSLVAKAVAFDTIGFLGTQNYYDHRVYRNKSIGWLIDTVLSKAKEQYAFITWSVEADLYDIIIPIAWFNNASYAAALNRIASCDLVNIYCMRDGSIKASKRLSGVQSPDDVWSDATNIIDKNYPTLYTTLPNYLDVYVARITTVAAEEVLNVADINHTVTVGEVLSYVFSSPIESLTTLQVSSSASYTYEWYSWGIRITFTSAGVLNSVVATGTALSVDSSTSIHLQDDDAIEEDGIITCEIKSDFIQTEAHATRLATYLYDRISESAYDVEVTYRGDIMLTLNNKVRLPEGIAPNNLYFIKRHELHWNGALSGSARLNT